MIEIDPQDDRDAFHQMMLEREELAADCLKKLAEGKGGQKEIEYLAAFARIQNPYELAGRV